MTIRHSTPDDIAVMQEIFREAKRRMRAEGNIHQWSAGYPSDALLLDDMRRGVSYVMEDKGEVVATFVLAICEDPTYKNIYEGRWLEDASEYGTIHRIASRNRQHGVMAAALEFAFAKTGNVRIDTHRDNTTMKRLMERYGVTYCGKIYLPGGDERLAYQKILKRN